MSAGFFSSPFPTIGVTGLLQCAVQFAAPRTAAGEYCSRRPSSGRSGDSWTRRNGCSAGAVPTTSDEVVDGARRRHDVQTMFSMDSPLADQTTNRLLFDHDWRVIDSKEE